MPDACNLMHYILAEAVRSELMRPGYVVLKYRKPEDIISGRMEIRPATRRLSASTLTRK